MKIFLSWSGERSKKTAEAISEFLKLVIQVLKPWMSPDIEKGKRWSPQIADQLEQAKVGIICLTRDNLYEPWILFESGALAKTLNESYVCTFLLDMKPSEVKEPLAQFQHTIFEKKDIRKLIKTINKAIKENGEDELDDTTLDKSFETFYPDLEQRINKILPTISVPEKIERQEKDILEEILEIVRRMERDRIKGRLTRKTGPFFSGDQKEIATPGLLEGLLQASSPATAETFVKRLMQLKDEAKLKDSEKDIVISPGSLSPQDES